MKVINAIPFCFFLISCGQGSDFERYDVAFCDSENRQNYFGLSFQNYTYGSDDYNLQIEYCSDEMYYCIRNPFYFSTSVDGDFPRRWEVSDIEFTSRLQNNGYTVVVAEVPAQYLLSGERYEGAVIDRLNPVVPSRIITTLVDSDGYVLSVKFETLDELVEMNICYGQMNISDIF